MATCFLVGLGNDTLTCVWFSVVGCGVLSWEGVGFVLSGVSIVASCGDISWDGALCWNGRTLTGLSICGRGVWGALSWLCSGRTVGDWRLLLEWERIGTTNVGM